MWNTEFTDITTFFEWLEFLAPVVLNKTQLEEIVEQNVCETNVIAMLSFCCI